MVGTIMGMVGTMVVIGGILIGAITTGIIDKMRVEAGANTGPGSPRNQGFAAVNGFGVTRKPLALV